VKLPVTTTRGEPLFTAVRELCQANVKVNLTALFTTEQVGNEVEALSGGALP
jgi:transaldolase